LSPEVTEITRLDWFIRGEFEDGLKVQKMVINMVKEGKEEDGVAKIMQDTLD
jgi:hypothetical protein